MYISQYLEAIAMSAYGSLRPDEAPVFDEKMTFVNDFEDVVKQRMVEYTTWYSGDSDSLWNLYNYNMKIEFWTEPYFWKNRRTYFWSRASQESEFKLTHSGFGRAMVDTTVAILGTPMAKMPIGEVVPWMKGHVEEERIDPSTGASTVYVPEKYTTQAVLNKILEANSFWSMYRREQVPMTLVEGWGAYKITWDKDVYGEDPAIFYYRAENCRIYKRGTRVIGITFLDWSRGLNGKRYLVAETRMMKGIRHGTVRFDCFVADETGQNLMPVEEGDPCIPVVPKGWKNMPCLFATPCSFFNDSLHGYAGRSVFEGKVDLLDDLDQALSMQANTTRRSCPIETFNLDYVDRDKDGAPKYPKTFERRYVMIRGAKAADGSSMSDKPVDVTQPNLNTDLYNADIEEKQRLIINGFLSPSTLGLDVSKKDNADAQREKEKITIFTRGLLATEEKLVLEDLFKQLLIAKEFLATGKITCDEYDIDVQYDEFSDTSFESKIDTLSRAMANDAISPEMYVNKLYGMSISDEAKTKEIAWLEEKHKQPEPPEAEDEDNPFADMDDGGDDDSSMPDEGGAEEGE